MNFLRRKIISKLTMIIFIIGFLVTSHPFEIDAATQILTDNYYWAEYEVTGETYYGLRTARDGKFYGTGTWERGASEICETKTIDPTTGDIRLRDRIEIEDEKYLGYDNNLTQNYESRVQGYTWEDDNSIRIHFYFGTRGNHRLYLYSTTLDVVEQPVVKNLIRIVHSNDSNAYPNQDMKNGKYYEFLGKKGDSITTYVNKDGNEPKLYIKPDQRAVFYLDNFANVKFENTDASKFYWLKGMVLGEDSMICPAFLVLDHGKMEFKYIKIEGIEQKIQYRADAYNYYDGTHSIKHWTSYTETPTELPKELGSTTLLYFRTIYGSIIMDGNNGDSKVITPSYWAKYSGNRVSEYRLEYVGSYTYLDYDYDFFTEKVGADYYFDPSTGDIDILGDKIPIARTYNDDDYDFNYRYYSYDGSYFRVWEYGYDTSLDDWGDYTICTVKRYKVVRKEVCDKIQFEGLVYGSESDYTDKAFHTDGFWYEYLGSDINVYKRYKTKKKSEPEYEMYQVRRDLDARGARKGYEEYEFDPKTGDVEFRGDYDYPDDNSIYYFENGCFIRYKERERDDRKYYYAIDKVLTEREDEYDYVIGSSSTTDEFLGKQEGFEYDIITRPSKYLPLPPSIQFSDDGKIFTLKKGGVYLPNTGISQYKITREGDVYQDWINYSGDAIDIPYKINSEIVIYTRTIDSNGEMSFENRIEVEQHYWGIYTYHTELIYELEEINDQSVDYFNDYVYVDYRLDRETGELKVTGKVRIEDEYDADGSDKDLSDFYRIHNPTTLYKYYYDRISDIEEYHLRKVTYRVVPKTVYVRDELQGLVTNPRKDAHPINETYNGLYYEYLGNSVSVGARYVNAPYSKYYMVDWWQLRTYRVPSYGYESYTLDQVTGQITFGSITHSLPFYKQKDYDTLDDGYDYWYEHPTHDRGEQFVKAYREFDSQGAFHDYILTDTVTSYTLYNRTENFWVKGIAMPEPTVVLNYPDNNFTAIGSTQQFKWTINHPLNIMKFTTKLYIDGQLRIVQPYTEGGAQEATIYLGDLADGWHTWHLEVEMGF